MSQLQYVAQKVFAAPDSIASVRQLAGSGPGRQTGCPAPITSTTAWIDAHESCASSKNRHWFPMDACKTSTSQRFRRHFHSRVST